MLFASNILLFFECFLLSAPSFCSSLLSNVLSFQNVPSHVSRIVAFVFSLLPPPRCPISHDIIPRHRHRPRISHSSPSHTHRIHRPTYTHCASIASRRRCSYRPPPATEYCTLPSMPLLPSVSRPIFPSGS